MDKENFDFGIPDEKNVEIESPILQKLETNKDTSENTDHDLDNEVDKVIFRAFNEFIDYDIRLQTPS